MINASRPPKSILIPRGILVGTKRFLTTVREQIGKDRTTYRVCVRLAMHIILPPFLVDFQVPSTTTKPHKRCRLEDLTEETHQTTDPQALCPIRDSPSHQWDVSLIFFFAKPRPCRHRHDSRTICLLLSTRNLSYPRLQPGQIRKTGRPWQPQFNLE